MQHQRCRPAPRGYSVASTRAGPCLPTAPLPPPPTPACAQLRDTFVHGDRVHLVLECCAGDLTGVIKDRSLALTEAHVKGFMRQVLDGVAYLHARRLMHR